MAAAFRRRSIAALPVVLVGERPLREGAYPSRAELAASLGLTADAGAEEVPAPHATTSCALGLHG